MILIRVVLVLILSVLLTGFSTYKQGISVDFTTVRTAQAAESVDILISAIGDCVLGNDYRASYQGSFDGVFAKNRGDYSYFFRSVYSVLSKDDLTIANLETPLTLQKERIAKNDVKDSFWFKGSPHYVNILKQGSIEAVNLANNHTFDYKEIGYSETRKYLGKGGIGYFGYSHSYIKTVKGIKVGMVGFNQLGSIEQGVDYGALKKNIEETIRNVKKESNLVIASFHWGKENSYDIDETQRELAHFTVDCGADMVIGHHPHVVQAIEKYKNRYIAFSLGNFCFGGNSSPEDFDTYILQQKFTFNKEKEIKNISGPIVIPCSISSVSGVNDYRPVLLKGPDAERILEKIQKGSNIDIFPTERKKEFVILNSFIKDIVIDLAYAKQDNFTGEKIYKDNTAYLRRGTAEKLRKASELLREKGYLIKVWDAYRPPSCQNFLWSKAVNKSFFAAPEKGSNHSRGASVDITITDMKGNEVDMPSKFDEMSGKATRGYKYATDKQRENSVMLENIMEKCGFIPLYLEWWHFDDSDCRQYDLVDSVR
ncbi:MAG: CapA family protein [Clostridia bacterium]|nr:CapA family protein [Clostridia bacterium]